MNIDKLKELAKLDMNGGEIGFAEAEINGVVILITAKKWGANKPGRKNTVRFTETTK